MLEADSVASSGIGYMSLHAHGPPQGLPFNYQVNPVRIHSTL